MNRILLAAAFALCASLAAQEPIESREESLKGIVPKGLAPVDQSVLRVTLPRPAHRRLPNGLTVLALENGRAGEVAIALMIPASGLHDAAAVPGVGGAVASIIRRGAGNRDAKGITAALGQMGARLNIRSENGSRFVTIFASVLPENFDPMMDLIADMAIRPTLPEEELNNWKERKLAAIDQQYASPSFVAEQLLLRALYPADQRSIRSTAETVHQITREHLAAFHRTFYRPNESILAISGPLPPQTIWNASRRCFSPWQPAAAPAPQLKPPLVNRAARVYTASRPGSVQTQLLIGGLAIQRTSPDYASCMVLNHVLGEAPDSRLFRNLREEKGLTYGIGSLFTAMRYMSHFAVSSSVQTESAPKAVSEILAEYRALRERPVAADELSRAKRAIVAHFALSLEYQETVLRLILEAREFGLAPDYWDLYPEKIAAVTAEDVTRVARKYLSPANVQIIAVGNIDAIAASLARFGTVRQEGETVPEVKVTAAKTTARR